MQDLLGTKEYIAFQQDSFYGHLNVDILDNGKLLVGTFVSENGYIIDEFSISKSSDPRESSPYYQIYQSSLLQKQAENIQVKTDSLLSLPDVIAFYS
jgi:hypothetical protein